MLKSKIKKIAGAAVIAGALLVSVSPAKAETLPGLIWVMDKYTDAFKFDMFIKNGNENGFMFTQDYPMAKLMWKK